MNPNLLIIVARAPIPGTTKTRLAATIGADRACALYRAFLADLAHRFSPRPGPDGLYDFAWSFTPADADFRSAIASISGKPIDPATIFVPQHGNGLNERLTNLFRWAFRADYRRVAIMASDSPQLPISVATEAFTILTTHDLTLGRVADGGYYLIGLSRFSELLLNLPMSTSNAADAVAMRARFLNLRVAELPSTFDVDEEPDLHSLRLALSPDGTVAPTTWTALQELGLVGQGSPCPDLIATEDALTADD